MAVYKIFPEKDAFILSEAPKINTGLDEILELGAYPSLDGQGQSSRILIKFSEEDLNKVQTIIGNTDFTASIRLFLAEAHQIPVNYSIEASPIYLPGQQEWEQGINKRSDVPNGQSGVSWEGINEASKGDLWPLTPPVPGVTGSYLNNIGGGTWFTGSFTGIDNHQINSIHDLNIDVSTAIRAINDTTIDNKGFIIKLEDSLEFNTGTPLYFKYFSKDTNTIYPPVLEIAWDDSEYLNTLQELTTDLATIRVSNNRGVYKTDSKHKFKLAVRPKFPPRSFSTTSIFTVEYRLPEGSLWALKDEYTDEMIIDFNQTGTRISADAKSSYFTIYMDGIQPERYYRILIKTVIDGSELVLPLEEPFKVVRNG